MHTDHQPVVSLAGLIPEKDQNPSALAGTEFECHYQDSVHTPELGPLLRMPAAPEDVETPVPGVEQPLHDGQESCFRNKNPG